MPFQQLTQLAGAMEALSSCVEVQALLTTLLIQAKELCRAEVAWGWLMVDADQLRLQRVEGEPSTLPARLRRMKMPAGGGESSPVACAESAIAQFSLSPCTAARECLE